METASDNALVLISGHDSALRQFLAETLKLAGIACLEEERFQTADDSVAPSLLILDLEKTDDGGVTAMAEARRRWPRIEIIVATTTAQRSAAIEALSMGAFAYLLKPVCAEELVHQAGRALEHRQLIDRRAYARKLEQRIREQTDQLRRANAETAQRLVLASSYRDVETGSHMRRVGLFSERLAHASGWDSASCDRICMAAPMHDIGKIGIPDEILSKPGKLTTEEFAVMKTHTTIGARMLEGTRSDVLIMARQIALCHHERWDGSGYPNGVAAQAIPEAARIVALADVYDALSHDRVYRSALPESEIIQILLEGRGTHFEPRLLDLFLSNLAEISRIAQLHPDSGARDELFAPQVAQPELTTDTASVLMALRS